MTPLLEEFREVAVIFHVFGFAVGLGAATVTDAAVARYVHGAGSKGWNAETIAICSRLIWCALGLILLSGLALYIPEAAELSRSSKFLGKMSVVAVLVVNGWLFSKLVAPRLTRLFCYGSPESGTRLHRRLAFVSGGVSATSWYGAVVLGSLPQLELGYLVIMSIYAAVLAAASLLGLVAEAWFHRSISAKSSDILQGVARQMLDDFNVSGALWPRRTSS